MVLLKLTCALEVVLQVEVSVTAGSMRTYLVPTEAAQVRMFAASPSTV